MLLEVEVSAEPFAADAAGEGLLVVVRVHVEGEVVHLVEGLVLMLFPFDVPLQRLGKKGDKPRGRRYCPRGKQV